MESKHHSHNEGLDGLSLLDGKPYKKQDWDIQAPLDM